MENPYRLWLDFLFERISNGVVPLSNTARSARERLDPIPSNTSPSPAKIQDSKPVFGEDESADMVAIGVFVGLADADAVGCSVGVAVATGVEVGTGVVPAVLAQLQLALAGQASRRQTPT